MVWINLLNDWTPEYREPATTGEIIEVILVALVVAALLSGAVYFIFRGVVYLVEWYF
jgi:hypothetical protein